MTEHRIFESRRFLRDVESIPPHWRDDLLKRLHEEAYPSLRRNPYHGDRIRKLVDWKPATWRYRIGPWRVTYEIDALGRTVYLTGLIDRKDAYCALGWRGASSSRAGSVWG